MYSATQTSLIQRVSLYCHLIRFFLSIFCLSFFFLFIWISNSRMLNVQNAFICLDKSLSDGLIPGRFVRHYDRVIFTPSPTLTELHACSSQVLAFIYWINIVYHIRHAQKRTREFVSDSQRTQISVWSVLTTCSVAHPMGVVPSVFWGVSSDNTVYLCVLTTGRFLRPCFHGFALLPCCHLD